MRPFRLATSAALLVAALAPLACGDGAAAPTAAGTTPADAGMTADVIAQSGHGPFTVRAPLEPFRVHQLPSFLMHSNTTSDIVMQRNVFQPGAGGWHTHPGVSFVYVVEGEIKLERYTKKDGCSETPVYVAGDAYFEVAGEVHRAVVLSSTPAVLLVTRFNVPTGGPITVSQPAPGC